MESRHELGTPDAIRGILCFGRPPLGANHCPLYRIWYTDRELFYAPATLEAMSEAILPNRKNRDTAFLPSWFPLGGNSCIDLTPGCHGQFLRRQVVTQPIGFPAKRLTIGQDKIE